MQIIYFPGARMCQRVNSITVARTSQHVSFRAAEERGRQKGDEKTNFEGRSQALAKSKEKKNTVEKLKQI